MANIPTTQEFKLFEEKLLRRMEEKIEKAFKTQNKPDVKVKVYTSADLEMFLKITANTVKKYREEGLSFIRISNGEYRYLYEDVIKFLRDNKFNYKKNLL